MAAFMTACGSKTTTVAVSSAFPAVVYAHSVAVNGGKVYAWGYNGYGQLGNNSINSSNVPIEVPGLPTGMTGVSAGGSHTLAFKNMSGVFAWGNNHFGQLGNGNKDAQMVPVQVTSLTNVSAVSAGGNHSLALDHNNNVWAWGDDSTGQLGDDVSLSQKTAAVQVPVPVDPEDPAAKVTMIAAGGLHSLALKGDKVWAWGSNAHGQLGNNSTSAAVPYSSTPVPVVKQDGTALTGIIAIAAGGSHSLALDDKGAVWSWGFNSNGQLGNGHAGDVAGLNEDKAYAVKVIDLPVPILVPISVAPGTQPLAAGLTHSLFIDHNKNVWGWGLNFHGQLGNGESRDIKGKHTPVQVMKKNSDDTLSPLSDVTRVVAVGNHSLALAGGAMWAWGENTFGQLGNNTTNNSSAALPVNPFP